MARNTSDQAGRALEYIIVKEMLKSFPNINIIGSTKADQNRDKLKFQNLELHQQSYYLKSARATINWVERKFNASGANTIQLERLPDSAARKGNVTDISLIIDNNPVNLSLKHNHTALKHQRPPSTAIQCGYLKKSVEDETYRKQHKAICEDFLKKAKELNPEITTFAEMKNIYPDFINEDLYHPVCENVTNFLNDYASNSPNAQSYFTFLAGNTDFYKIIVRPKSLRILEFADMPKVISLQAELHNKSYVYVSFSNGWKISMRLHTASSRIKGVSLKFDTQAIDLDIPEETISL